MFKRILIANRGEIAVRIIRACRDLGIISVAVYSTADKDSLHKYIADESICIGPAPAKDSYLNMKAIISAALATGADAIHPGYGFLSENIQFAKMCEDNGIEFIGPSHKSIKLMGDKITAKQTMINAGVPVVPGSDGEIKNVAEAKKIAKEIGYPVMIKASSGGGGRGIRFVDKEEDLERHFLSAKVEAKANFGDEAMYMEKCIIKPRHVEIQVLGDKFGNVVHLYERDCSLQRRHQKMIEESPCTFIDDATREEMGKAAVRAAKACGYYSAGTIEFLVDSDKNFYFMEMNTRVQVEHPVTEYVTGVDIVKEQILVAQGENLSVTQDDIKIKGHAIECRITAEDPARNFAPCPGTVYDLNVPGGLGVRVDSAIYQDYKIPPYYDSMIAKVIVHGNDKTEAIARMKRALSEFICTGIVTNIDFLLDLLYDENVVNGNFHIEYLDEKLKSVIQNEIKQGDK